MGNKNQLSMLFVVAGFISTLGLAGTAVKAADGDSPSRCVADLSRVKNDFCISASHVAFGSAPASPLNYSWSLNDDRFDLVSKACLSSDGVVGERQDVVIALDRSRSMWVVDGTNAKNGTVSIAATKLLIDAMKSEADSNPEQAAKIGVMLFSTDDSCEQYNGGTIAVDRVFPCLYVPAGSAADSEHIKKLHEFLNAAEGKYSQGGLDRGSDYGIVSQAMRANLLELDQTKRSGLVLFSDGRTYAGKANDTFAYLRSENYKAAQSDALTKFGAREMRQFKVVFALATMPEIFVGPIHKEEYQNMCALPEAAAVDCKSPVNLSKPETWPVNTIDLKAFAEAMVSKTGGPATNVLMMTDKEKIKSALDILRFSAEDILKIEAVSWSIDGSTYQAGQFSENSIQISSIEAANTLNLDLLLRAGAREVSVPFKIALTRVASTNAELASAEMLCAGDGAGAPKISLKNLQGGSASCAVVGESSSSQSATLLFMMSLPLIVGLAFLRRKNNRISASGAAFILTIAAVGSNGETAKAEDGGLNVLQYRPVIEGNGAAETATPLQSGTYSAGMYLDYANDALELGVEKNQRSRSVVDDLVTTHFVGNVGVASNFSLGIHAPFVASVQVDRETDGSDKGSYKTTRISDVAVFGKIKLLNRPAYSLGLMPVVTAPTGDSESLTGDGSSNYGMMVLVSGGDSLITWSANLGYLQREKSLEVEDSRAKPIVVRGQYLVYLGTTWKATSVVSVAGSFQLKATAGETFDFTNSNPSEWGLTTNYHLNSQTILSGTFGTGLGKGYGSPDYRAVAGIAYVPSVSKSAGVPKTQVSQRTPARR